MRVYRGHLLHIGGAPRSDDVQAALVNVPDGALAVDGSGTIAYSGEYRGLPEAAAAAEVIDCRPGFLLPGFVDTHLHFPQTHCVDSHGGGQLLDWLERCIFPAESMLVDDEYARGVATEYISCPSCGRTLFDLEETTSRVRAATGHLKGLKIGVMGCIVNGPGEMADADYGYVGVGPGKISLYKKQEVVKKNIPTLNAIEELIDLIRENGDWIDQS